MVASVYQLTSVRDHLQVMAEFFDRDDHHQRKDWRYRSIESMILDLGREFTFERKPRGTGVRMGRMKMCFSNAARASWQRDTLAYCEGYAVGRGSIPCLHAWVSPGDGRAWDVTWRDGGSYFGIEWDRDWYRAFVARSGYFGVFGSGDYHAIGELLKVGPPRGAVVR